MREGSDHDDNVDFIVPFLKATVTNTFSKISQEKITHDETIK